MDLHGSYGSAAGSGTSGNDSTLQYYAAAAAAAYHLPNHASMLSGGGPSGAAAGGHGRELGGDVLKRDMDAICRYIFEEIS